ncbi:unnamed protein product [Symbiodinium microadriaticum]|nr:unnamed protein product [Symbiodinium sp. KB8]CAE7867794.1 unnamed protein product [Symbiodinium microadriaticum]
MARLLTTEAGARSSGGGRRQLMMFSSSIKDLAKAFDSLLAGEVLKGVVLCTGTRGSGTAFTMPEGSKLKFSLSLVVIDKAKGTDTIPGKVAGQRRFANGFIHKVHSDGVQDLKKAPNRSVMAWAAKYGLRFVDTFGWKEQRSSQGIEQLYGMIRVEDGTVKDVLRVSATEGIFIEPRRKQFSEKGEAHDAYLERFFKGKGELGLATCDNILGDRFELHAGDRVKRAWLLRAAANVDADRDAVPVTIIYDGSETSLGPDAHEEGFLDAAVNTVPRDRLVVWVHTVPASDSWASETTEVLEWKKLAGEAGIRENDTPGVEQQCPLRPATGAKPHRIHRNLDEHKRSKHPPWKVWNHKRRVAAEGKKTLQKYNATLLANIRNPGDILKDFAIFRWRMPGKPKTKRPVHFQFAWTCRCCRTPFMKEKDARSHREKKGRMKGRCAAGLFDFEASAGRFITVLAVAVYGFASSDAEARAGPKRKKVRVDIRERELSAFFENLDTEEFFRLLREKTPATEQFKHLLQHDEDPLPEVRQLAETFGFQLTNEADVLGVYSYAMPMAPQQMFDQTGSARLRFLSWPGGSGRFQLQLIRSLVVPAVPKAGDLQDTRNVVIAGFRTRFKLDAVATLQLAGGTFRCLETGRNNVCSLSELRKSPCRAPIVIDFEASLAGKGDPGPLRSAQVERHLTDTADESARACMQRRLKGSARQRWHEQIEKTPSGKKLPSWQLVKQHTGCRSTFVQLTRRPRRLRLNSPGPLPPEVLTPEFRHELYWVIRSAIFSGVPFAT